MQTSALYHIVSQIVNHDPEHVEITDSLLCTQVHCAFAPQSIVSDKLTNEPKRQKDHKKKRIKHCDKLG